MIASLRQHQFDTVLGPLDFDDKGDLTVHNLAWYVLAGRHLRAAGAKPLTRAHPPSVASPSRVTFRQNRDPWPEKGGAITSRSNPI